MPCSVVHIHDCVPEATSTTCSCILHVDICVYTCACVCLCTFTLMHPDGKTVSGRRACLTKPPPQDVKYSSGRKKGATKKEAVSKTPAKVKRLAVVVKKEEEDMAVTESDSDLSVSSTLSGRKVLAGSKRRGGQGKKPVSPSVSKHFKVTFHGFFSN